MNPAETNQRAVGRPFPFFLACLLEGSLLGVAGLASWLTGRSLLGHIRLPLDLFAGAAATLPMFAVLFWVMRSENPQVLQLRQFFDSVLRVALRRWPAWQLITISLIAGVSEEAFFRGFLQGELAGHLGWLAGLVLASALFAACHWITRLYAALAGCIGLWLGVVLLLTHGLLAPIVAHALYDAAALVYLLRLRR